ncbi:MgtC/SapB family protein [Bradyrhizobium sediminis]|uniref:MgtC/SapB family protein n=1 Tax=Bradyrhizobium sediminis TaxID=2840469 RepID=A0A975P025_9BRAD|nr:MgtC/SapB family protein [Bradyrhizobium sediminis]QWG24457.1 MgtC/SapB family protein [Bradyrhizobium sediminis]
MLNLDPVLVNLAVAIGIGILIGAERERRKGEGPARSPAGIRTFSVASLAGAASVTVGGTLVLAITIAGVAVLAAIAHFRSREDDPGLTTEIALILTALLGGLSMQRPALAAGTAVALAILLAARTPLHHFVRSVLTEGEVNDALIFASASLVVLPLLPDQALGLYAALNPRSIWIVVLLVMAISAVGHVAVRVLGARFGIPIAGLASGFISSTATIGAMGMRARKNPDLLAATVSGAALSTVATIVQMALVIAATSVMALQTLSIPLLCAGIVAAAYGAGFTARALREEGTAESQPGRAFSLPAALVFGLTVSAMLVASAALREWFGETGVIVAAAAAGFVDTHSAAIAVASLVASGKMTAADAVFPILAGLSTNTVSKMIFAWSSGGGSFAVRLIPGLILVAVAAWAGALMQ